MKHELWIDDGLETFCLAGPHGDDARALLEPSAKLAWTCEAGSPFEAMTLFYAHMGWGEYSSNYPEQDKQPYSALGWE